MRIGILFGGKNSQNVTNDARFEESPYEVQFIGKMIQEVAKLEQRIALLVELEYGAILGFTVGEI